MTVLGLAVLVGVLGMTALMVDNLRRFRRAPAAPAAPVPAVSVLIPARDEEASIEAAVRAACAQTTDVEVIVLDDGSRDATPVILRRLAAELPRLRVLPGTPLPQYWAGKAWACWQLAVAARHDWILFVDADVRLAPDAAARAMALARADDADFASGFPRQVTASPGEALLVPLIHLVLLAYLPFRLLRDGRWPSVAAGCGQLMLARRAAYFAADGHRAIRGSLHDGLQLARRMKRVGFPIAVFDATDLAACRMYEGLGAAWRGFARNAYEALGSPATLTGLVALNLALFVAPFVGLAAAAVAGGVTVSVPWGVAVAVVTGLRLALAARFEQPRWIALATPAAVLLLAGIQINSFVNHVIGRPVMWRARAYAPPAAAGGR